jgi:hypothetical protein
MMPPLWLRGKSLVKNLIAIVGAIALAACAGNTDSTSAIALVNGGFEQTASDGSIPGWTMLQHVGPPSYEMVIEAEGAYVGHGSFRMTRTHEQVYGSLTQDVAVDKAAGVVELSAMLKTRDVGPEGWKLMIQTAQASEFSTKLTGSSEWQRVTVRATLPPGTTSITIGVTLLDSGTGWMDDVALKTIAR